MCFQDLFSVQISETSSNVDVFFSINARKYYLLIVTPADFATLNPGRFPQKWTQSAWEASSGWMDGFLGHFLNITTGWQNMFVQQATMAA